MICRTALRTFGFIALTLTGGCASEPAYQILTPFLDSDFQTWKQSGQYTVSGQAFFKRPDGQVMTCAGESVSLMPLTGYNMELSKLLESGKGYPPNYERRAHKYDHKTMCGGDGKFSFDGVAPLNWLVITRVSWHEDSMLSAVPLIGGPDVKGGWLYQEISVDGADKKVTLSNQDFVADRD